jgi:hypothetical protein
MSRPFRAAASTQAKTTKDKTTKYIRRPPIGTTVKRRISENATKKRTPGKPYQPKRRELLVMVAQAAVLEPEDAVCELADAVVVRDDDYRLV